MKAKQFLGLFVAMFVALLAVNVVNAGALNVTINDVEVNDVSGSITLSGSPGETLPVEVTFTADANYDDLKLKVWVDGYKSDISESTSRFDVLKDRTYIKRLALDLPAVEDFDDLNEDLTLHVRISDKNDEIETEFDITVQRESYVYNLLSVETPIRASAGDIIAVDVVLKNVGSNELEDSFVTASIPELDLYRKVYFGDLTPEDDVDSDGKQDARERRIYLVLPSDSITGDYDIVVKASNYDSSNTVIKSISISGLTIADDAIKAETVKDEGVPTSIIVLTVVLVIIFVVLLIVLIVLLTKKPADRIEDFGETSYY